MAISIDAFGFAGTDSGISVGDLSVSGFDVGFGGPGSGESGYGRGSYISQFDVQRGEWAQLEEANRAAAYRNDVLSGVRSGAGAGMTFFGIPGAFVGGAVGGLYASNTSSNRPDGAAGSRGDSRGGASIEGPDEGGTGDSFPDPGVDESAPSPSLQSPQPARQAEPAPRTNAPVTGITRVNDEPLDFGGALSDIDAQQAEAEAAAAAAVEAAAEEDRRRNAIRRTINPTGPQGLLTRPTTSKPTLEGLLL